MGLKLLYEAVPLRYIHVDDTKETWTVTHGNAS